MQAVGLWACMHQLDLCKWQAGVQIYACAVQLVQVELCECVHTGPPFSQVKLHAHQPATRMAQFQIGPRLTVGLYSFTIQY